MTNQFGEGYDISSPFNNPMHCEQKNRYWAVNLYAVYRSPVREFTSVPRAATGLQQFFSARELKLPFSVIPKTHWRVLICSSTIPRRARWPGWVCEARVEVERMYYTYWCQSPEIIDFVPSGCS